MRDSTIARTPADPRLLRQRAGITLSIVTPCYNEEAALPTFFERMLPALEGLGVTWEIICVDDGSTDRTMPVLLEHARTEKRLRIVQLSRNFGKEAAMTAGLEFAAGNAVVLFDVDLQDPPELLARMLACWREGFDVVYATRTRRRSDSFLKRNTAHGFYRLYNWLAAVPIPPNAGDFRLMDRHVVDALLLLPERNRFMKGLFGWLGFRQTEVQYERQARSQGTTKFSYWRLWNFALDGLTSFSTVPLRIWTYVGSTIALLSFLYATLLIIRTLIYGIDTPGYASLMVVVLFLGGMQLISLGILGEYIGRAFSEVKQRPVYLTDRLYNFDLPEEAAEPAAEDAANDAAAT